MATFRQATIAGEQMENPVFTGPSDIYSVYWISVYWISGVLDFWCTGFLYWISWIFVLDFPGSGIIVVECSSTDLHTPPVVNSTGERMGYAKNEG
jgi:hypothetical protein